MTQVKPIVVGVLLLFGAGCAMDRSAIKSADVRPCVTNYSTSGDFWAGKQFKSYQVFQGIPASTAFDRVASAIASKGLQITSSDKQLGTLSAVKQVVSTAGKQVPLNAIVKNEPGGGVRVELVYTLTGMLATSADGVQDNFCDILAAVSKTHTSNNDKGASVIDQAGSTSAQSKSTTSPSKGGSNRSGSDSEFLVREAQQRLALLGYNPGPADGQAGSRTLAALKLFQADNGLPVTGQLDTETAALLSQRSSQGASRTPTGANAPKQSERTTPPRESQPPREKKAVTDL